VDRIIASRRSGQLRLDDVTRLTTAISRSRAFIIAADWQPGKTLDDSQLQQKLVRQPAQLSLFQ
jgi:predicted DNA-binding helix-hairpin-helix protein